MNLTITILGFGNIGKQICTSLLAMEDHAFVINVIEVSTQVEGAYIDFEHARELFPAHQIVLNNERAFNESDFVFHCAGASIPAGKSRLEVTNESICITEEIFKEFKPKKDCKIIVISNPVEIISHVTQKITGLPATNIVGTGTYLDSIRMDHYVRKNFPSIVNPNLVLLGEHGTTVFMSQQLSRINETNVEQVLRAEQIESLLDLTKGAAKKIKETQTATIYAVSFCAIHIFKALLKEEKSYIPSSIEMPDFLCELLESEKIFLSLYSAINNQGVRYHKEYQPGEEELFLLKESYRNIVKYIPGKYLD